MMVETYLRRGQRRLQRLALDPRVRRAGAVAAYGGGGFFLSAASLGSLPQPLAAGALAAVSGWQGAVMTLGAMAGYPVFWGRAGLQGMVWSAAGGLLAVLLGKRQERLDQPLMLPAITAFLVAVTGLVFQLWMDDKTPVVMYLLRIFLTFAVGTLFTQAAACREPMVDWMVCGVGVLALAQVGLGPWLSLGETAAGLIAVAGAFPAAALAGLGLDLAQVRPVPMTAVLCLAYFIRLIPFDKKWQHYAAPGFSAVIVMAACGTWDPHILPGLILGGSLGVFLPPRPRVFHRRGDTGAAQVRLEMGAEVMTTLQHLLLELEPPPIDQEAILDRARDRSCGSCSARKHCETRTALEPRHLLSPLEADCRKQGRLVPELRRGAEQLKELQADRARRREYREALVQQYQFLSGFLRNLADQLPRRGTAVEISFRVEAAARSRGKERANGDRCLAFSGGGSVYYVLLCDGMGTGLGAAQEGQAAGDLMRRMLLSGFPASHALGTVNSLLALRGAAGAVTLDLAQVRLDTGIVTIYKWGAAPSWLLTRRGAEKIGTASPPPGISLGETKETVEKLSLRRGEVLVLLSDGADGEECLGRTELSPDAPPGELAAKILSHCCQTPGDDATAAVIRLKPVSMAIS